MKVETTELMAIKDIADRLETSPAMVHSYYGRRDTTGFPEFVAETSGGRLWLRPQIEAWVRMRNSVRPKGGRKRILPEAATV